MSLLTMLFVVLVVGVLLWLAEVHIPMNSTVRRILIAVVVCVLVLWVLDVFGLLDAVRSVRIGKVRG